MTPSRMGRITWIAPGVRPSISRASFPTAHMVHVAALSAAAGRQPGQDERRPRPHVQGPDAGTNERGRPANDSSGGPGSHYLRPHLAQLAAVQQTVIEHPLVHA